MLIVDTMCEIHQFIKEFADREFWDFSNETIVPGAIYVIGRRQMLDNTARIIDLVSNDVIKVIFSNPHEGSDTIRSQIVQYGLTDLVLTGKVIIVSGGDLPGNWNYLHMEKFLPEIFDYTENIAAAGKAHEIYSTPVKPYKFLCFNGRGRPHRRYLIERFTNNKLLDQALWTNLDSNVAPLHYLPAEYEVDRYQHQLLEGVVADTHYAKHNLFNNEWGEIYLTPAPYIDTYFSLVTETVFYYPYSFRTEKIWKPVVMQHPWITVANLGYYRDIRNLGFRTFGHLIDESFDSIENNQDRLERVATVIEDLCADDLPAFLAAAEDVCKYNYQLYQELRLKIIAEFPNRFIQFTKKHFNE